MLNFIYTKLLSAAKCTALMSFSVDKFSFEIDYDLTKYCSLDSAVWLEIKLSFSLTLNEIRDFRSCCRGNLKNCLKVLKGS